MLELIRENLPAIAEACRRRRVVQMDLFGSAARDDFNPASSDLDFLVLFQYGRNYNGSVEYMKLLGDLESILRRSVDLVDIRAVRNPYFAAEAMKNRVNVYVAEG